MKDSKINLFFSPLFCCAEKFLRVLLLSFLFFNPSCFVLQLTFPIYHRKENCQFFEIAFVVRANNSRRPKQLGAWMHSLLTTVRNTYGILSHEGNSFIATDDILIRQFVPKKSRKSGEPRCLRRYYILRAAIPFSLAVKKMQ